MSVLLREAIGDSIRRARTERRRTLRDVSHDARVSLGYLSEIERGRKEPSSELLASICEALSMTLPELLDDAAAILRPAGARRPAVDPALRSAVEEAFGPVGDDDAPARGATASTASTAPSGASGEARASAADPTLPPDALAGDEDAGLDGVLDGLAAGDLADGEPVPGTVSLLARLPVPGAGGPSVRVAA